MTDGNLLKYAAIAAGIKVHGLADKFVAQHVLGSAALCVANDKGGDSLWNPLTDDGDALRLGVKLGIYLEYTNEYTAAYAGTHAGKQFTEKHNTDPCAATRRAIVRAAAEIGEATP